MRRRLKSIGLAALSALALAALAAPAATAEEWDKYEVVSLFASLSTTQAGAHADLTIGFELSNELGLPYALTKDLHVQLPPGVIGNPQGIPRCSVEDLGNLPEESKCPTDAQVGISEVTIGGEATGSFTEPVYNMNPPTGVDVVARFGFFGGPYPATIQARVNPLDYSVRASVEGAPAAAGFVGAETTLWGVPAADSHDALRLTPLEAFEGVTPVGGRPAGLPEAPFLSNPTDCSLQREVTVTAVSYQLPGSPSSESAPFPDITGCGKLVFTPTFTLTPTNPEAAAPTGIDSTLTVPQDETPNGLATSTLRSAIVTLPLGMAINPAAGDGLGACSAEEVGFGEDVAPHCPDEAKIGSVEVDVPALEDTLKGSVYQRTPEPGNLFGFWVVTDEQGVRLKLPARIQASPLTGQLTTFFSGIESLGGNPQVPFSELRFHAFGGPRAPLATPAVCGTYQTAYQLTPWSGKPPVVGETPMQITTGCNKGGFNPGLSAGTRNASAGTFSPFALTLTRSDGEANPAQISVQMPQGLLAKLGGVPLCPEPEAASGACPAQSQVGTITAATGVGGAPLWIPQPGKAPTAVYLAGPYKGAPYSLVSVVPAQAGPFDLGLVVNRSAIYVDPNTALATIATDPLPQILEGVPVAYRTLHVETTRPEFTLNPTGCETKQIAATVTAANGAVATPSDLFHATECSRLPYAPKLKLSFKGPTKRTGHPAVKAVLTQDPGQANTKAATVILPKSEFIDQNHINNPCTRVQFNAGACPPGSVLGTVKAKTPLLDQPLQGNVYFRSNGGERELPDIVADLNGPVHIILVGFVDSVGKKGSEVRRIRTRFLSVPDAPVSRFEMNLFGGKRGLLVHSRNICKTDRKAKLSFRAHSGRVKEAEPVIASSCPKHHK